MAEILDIDHFSFVYHVRNNTPQLPKWVCNRMDREVIKYVRIKVSTIFGVVPARLLASHAYSCMVSVWYSKNWLQAPIACLYHQSKYQYMLEVSWISTRLLERPHRSYAMDVDDRTLGNSYVNASRVAHVRKNLPRYRRHKY